MKTLYKATKISIGVFLAALLMISCVPEQQSLDGAGQTLVKLNPAGFNMLAVDAKATPQTGILFEVLRDIPNEAALNTSTTVILDYDVSGALLTAYNTENETEFIPLPVTLATTDPALVGGKITLTFNAGEFSKALKVNIPSAASFDFSKQYALAFKLSEVSGTGKLSEGSEKTVVVQVLAKNKWDGVYEVTANTPMVDVANTAFTGYYPFIYELQTSGANSVKCYDKTVWYDFMHPMKNNGSTSGYGSFGLELFFDANGNIIQVKNPWGNPPSNTRMPVIDPSGVNKMDLVTKHIKFKYWMIQPSVVTTAPYIRVYFDEIWTYKGQR